MNINKLKEPIGLILEQFECESCKKKIYINSEDKTNSVMPCPFCEETSSSLVRQFEIKIEGIGEY